MLKFGKILHNARKVTGKLWAFCLRLRGVSHGSGLELKGKPIVTRCAHSAIILGDNVTLSSHIRYNPLCNNQPCVLRTMGKDSEIIIEDFVGISGSSICAASRITIGKGTIIGTGSVIMDTDFHHPDGEYRWDNDATSRSQPINIGRGVFIGTRCIILKGVTIGDRAIIAAGSVVAKDVAANTVVGSNTMQVLRHAY